VPFFTCTVTVSVVVAAALLTMLRNYSFLCGSPLPPGKHPVHFHLLPSSSAVALNPSLFAFVYQLAVSPFNAEGSKRLCGGPLSLFFFFFPPFYSSAIFRVLFSVGGGSYSPLLFSSSSSCVVGCALACRLPYRLPPRLSFAVILAIVEVAVSLFLFSSFFLRRKKKHKKQKQTPSHPLFSIFISSLSPP
jgi:hypothetical protein